jgi:chromosome segregation ATPase
LTNEVLKLDKSHQTRKDHEYKLKALDEKLEMAKKETATVDENNQQLTAEISKLENMKVERENEYAQAEQKKREELLPLIEECQKEIHSIHVDARQCDQEMDKQERENEQLQEKINQMALTL